MSGGSFEGLGIAIAVVVVLAVIGIVIGMPFLAIHGYHLLQSGRGLAGWLYIAVGFVLSIPLLMLIWNRVQWLMYRLSRRNR